MTSNQSKQLIRSISEHVSHSTCARAVLIASAVAAFGCSGSESNPGPSVGGNGNSVGGSAAATGGAPAASGGAPASGGSPATGGAVTGGAPAAGGVVSTGGTSTGGTRATGGASATGGSLAAGGSLATGGANVTGGALATGGRTSTGGAPATGGALTGGTGNPATGGAMNTGGVQATGGVSATGGVKATGGTTSTAPCATGSACIDYGALQQEIDGLGASSAWHGVLGTAVLDAAFSNSTLKQLGLSILRVDIDPAGQSAWGSQKTNATNAKSRGAKYVLATPWSPPASMKSNNNTVGGELNTASYAAYAAYLKSYYDYMGGAGGAVDIISVQNEPNITVSYTSATWSAAQLFNFTKNNAAAIGAPYMMPETYNYDLTYSDSSLNDATAAANISYIGLHLYGATMKTYTLAVQKQKKIWMTEYYFDPEDIGTMMSMAKQIMDCFNNQMNAYVWWYLVTVNCNLMNSSGTLTNKGYVMGQFSKYIRPGMHRATATYQPQTNINVQAFAGTPNVIVALNRNTSATSQTFTIANATVASLHKYTTSNSKKLSDDGTVSVTNNSFTVSLDAQSVTTFVAN